MSYVVGYSVASPLYPLTLELEMVARSSVGTTSIFGLDSMEYEYPITAIIFSIPNISTREHIKLWIRWTSEYGILLWLGYICNAADITLSYVDVDSWIPDDQWWWWRWWDLNNFLLITKHYQRVPPYFTEFWIDKTINFVLFPRVVINIVGGCLRYRC